jgi:hypothetical protein
MQLSKGKISVTGPDGVLGFEIEQTNKELEA